MPKLATPLIDIQVRNAKPKEKAYKLADGGSMYLEVMPTGSKLWRVKYRQANGSESLLVFGSYPEVSLLEARNKRTEARALLAKKIGPAQVRRDDKAETATSNANTFEKIAREWHTNRLTAWRASTAKDTINRLEKDIFPAIGKLPIATITRKVISVQTSVASSVAMC